MRVWLGLFVCALIGVSAAEAGTRTVCASGCQYSNLQPAIDAAVPGDTILLRAGQTFVGNFVLRAKSSTSTAFITIRSDAPDSSLPAAGVRLVPGGNVARSALARLLGKGLTYKSVPVLSAAAGAHHYRLLFLEIDGTANLGYETLVALGSSGRNQTHLSQVPHHIVFDRLYIHGHPTKGQKRGVALNSASTAILNSYITDIKSLSDAQAIAGFNGPGPFRIINNYLEAAGENVLFGGADPKIPNLIPSDIEIRGNHMYKRLAWRTNILTTPRPSVTSTSASGSLSAGTHFFKVVAMMSAGGAEPHSAASPEVSATVSSGRAVTLSWPAVAGADRYRVYRGTSAGGESRYVVSTGTSFTYKGVSEISGMPFTDGHRWTAKNLFELKNAQRVIIEGNVMEYSWAGFQDGYAILFAPRNQEGTAPWSVVRNVTLRNNIVRHAGAGIKILGRDYNYPSQQARDIVIDNNLFDDVSSTWGNTGRFLMITSGPANITVDHNTIVNTGSVVEVDTYPVYGFVFTNNIALHNTYGIKGQDVPTGLPTLTKRFPGYVFKGNVLAGGNATFYPPGNYFPPASSFRSLFADYDSGDFRLVSSSPYVTKGTDGTALGANISQLQAAQTLNSASLNGSSGGTDTSSVPSTTDQAPTAVAGGPYTVAAGTALLLDGSGSSDAEAPLAGYRWNYGEEIVLRAADVPSTNIHGRWARVSAGAAAGGIALQNTNQGDAKKTRALAEPTDYFDITFEAASGVPYYVWLRMRASRNSYSNDSVFVQFSGALNSSGSPVYRIGTTSGMGIVLEEGYGAGVAGWGWNDNGYGTLGIPVYFASSGPQTLRIQQREDGVTLDQLVISASAFAGKSPGEYKSDTTILPLNFGTESGITALHTYAHRGTYPVRLTVTDSKGQSGSDAAKASVR